MYPKIERKSQILIFSGAREVLGRILIINRTKILLQPSEKVNVIIKDTIPGACIRPECFLSIYVYVSCVPHPSLIELNDNLPYFWGQTTTHPASQATNSPLSATCYRWGKSNFTPATNVLP